MKQKTKRYKFTQLIEKMNTKLLKMYGDVKFDIGL
jgi:hypothetical protein